MRPRALKILLRHAVRRVMSVGAARETIRPLVRSGRVPVAIWGPLAFWGVFEVSVPGGGSFRYEAVPEDLIGRILYWRGLDLWEPETLAIAAKLARRARDFWDVGANTGAYALLACAANPSLRAWAFEPVPAVCQRLRRNVEVNGWEDRCAIFEVAVGNVSGRATLHVPEAEVLPSSASLNPDGFRGLRGSLIDVPIMELKNLIDADTPLDVIKVDVEGFEDAVLEGLGGWLGRKTPAVIVECNPDGPYRRVEALLKPHGYRFFHLGSDGPSERSEIVPDATEAFRNFVCVPPEKLSWLW